MAFIRTPDGIPIKLLQAGGAIQPAEPWDTMYCNRYTTVASPSDNLQAGHWVNPKSYFTILPCTWIRKTAACSSSTSVTYPPSPLPPGVENLKELLAGRKYQAIAAMH